MAESKDAGLSEPELAELERLEREATPGPWCFGHNPDGYDPLDYFRDAYAYGPPGRVHLTCIPVPGKDVNDEALFTAITGNGPTSEANAKLIATLRNHARSLIAAARENAELRAELTESRAALWTGNPVFAPRPGELPEAIRAYRAYREVHGEIYVRCTARIAELEARLHMADAFAFVTPSPTAQPERSPKVDELTLPDILVPTFPVPAARVKEWADSLTPEHLAALELQRVEKPKCEAPVCADASPWVAGDGHGNYIEIAPPPPNPHLAPERVEELREVCHEDLSELPVECYLVTRRAAQTALALIEHYESTKGSR